MSGEHHEFKVACVKHVSKGCTPTSQAFKLKSFPRARSNWTNTGQGQHNPCEAQPFFNQYLQRSTTVIDSVAPVSDWDKTALNLSLPQGKRHNQCLRSMLQWESASRPWFTNSSSLNSQGRGSPPHPVAHPTLLLPGVAVPAARTPGWLIRHRLILQLATQSTQLTRNRVQHVH